MWYTSFEYYLYYIIFRHISFFLKHCYHYTIYDIILISLHHTAGTFTLSIHCYLQWNCHFQWRYNCKYLRLLFDSIVYSAKNTGKHHVFVINICTCNCTILILWLLRFGFLHWYTIYNNTEWQFFIFLHFVDWFVWDCLIFIQYSYYRDLFCSGPALHLHDYHSHV